MISIIKACPADVDYAVNRPPAQKTRDGRYGLSLPVLCHHGILAAVQPAGPDRCGAKHIDMALAGFAVAVTGNQAMNYLTTANAASGWAMRTPNLTPYRGVSNPLTGI